MTWLQKNSVFLVLANRNPLRRKNQIGLVVLGAAFNGADPLFQCYYCRGIDISDCLDGSSVTVTTCPKGVHSCVMSYRKVGPSKLL